MKVSSHISGVSVRDKGRFFLFFAFSPLVQPPILPRIPGSYGRGEEEEEEQEERISLY